MSVSLRVTPARLVNVLAVASVRLAGLQARPVAPAIAASQVAVAKPALVLDLARIWRPEIYALAALPHPAAPTARPVVRTPPVLAQEAAAWQARVSLMLPLAVAPTEPAPTAPALVELTTWIVAVSEPTAVMATRMATVRPSTFAPHQEACASTTATTKSVELAAAWGSLVVRVCFATGTLAVTRDNPTRQHV